MLDLSSIDLEEIANALADQTDYCARSRRPSPSSHDLSERSDSLHPIELSILARATLGGPA